MKEGYEWVWEGIARQLECEPSGILPEHRFLQDLNLDSLDMVVLVCELERVCEVTIPEDDLYALTTVGELAEYLEKSGIRPV